MADDPIAEAATGGDDDRRSRRRRAMIDAARSLFVERGYESVSLSEIVRRSGGSLSTLYDLFENKQGLLGAIVQTDKLGGLGRIEAIIGRGDPPIDTLQAIAREVHDKLALPEAVGMMRVVMTEGLRSPDFARVVYETGHLPMRDCLAALFARWGAEGCAAIDNPQLLAELFMGLVLHGAQMRTMFCWDIADAACREDAIRIAVRLFARGVGLIDPA